MTQPKKYKMRPTRKDENGNLQQVPIGHINGHLSALASECTHQVTPAIHRAYMCGDIDIDDYPHERRGQPKKKASKKRASKASKPKPDPQPEFKLDVEPTPAPESKETEAD